MTSSLSDDLADLIDVPVEVQQQLARVRPRLGPIAGRLYWLARTTSTNDVAARLAESGAEEGTTVVAEVQTAGRGRQGRAWYSPAGAGLYVSVILGARDRQGTAESANPGGLLTLAAGVAVSEAIRYASGLPAEIKWPNDVLIGRRKIAGILVEAVAEANVVQSVVLGFGVNLRSAEGPPELAPRITSVEAETGRAPDAALLLAEILANIAGRCADLRAGRFDAILSAWRRLTPSLVSAAIEWDTPAGVRRGRVEGLDDRGALVVRVDGGRERIVAGEIRWL